MRRFDYENRSRVFLGMNPYEWRSFFIMLALTVLLIGGIAWVAA